MEDISGTVLRGYEVREQVATGGFGAIYRAFQASVGREVAIKVILPHLASQSEFIRHFETEARVIARLEHPHIVPLYDFWREPEGAYLVMRWYPAGSLREELDAGMVDRADLLTWAGQICGALGAAHQRGVVHRDVKPENIVLDRERNAFLTDFGIAKVLDPTEGAAGSGDSPGSPAYAAPEQALGRSISAQTDLYSLGIVLFELMTGQHPFEGLPAIEQVASHLHEPIPAVRAFRPELPDAIDEVIQTATAKEPGARYADAASMFAAIREAYGKTAESADVSSPAPGPIINPYKGLRAFQEADAADFYGREALVDELLDEFHDSRKLSRFIAIVGPSGSGKSSLVKAGLVPAIKTGRFPGSQNWYVLQIQPGHQPLDELEAGLQGLAANRVAELRDQLDHDRRGLVRAAESVLPADSAAELLLIVDQFEEIFSTEAQASSAKHFMDLIGEAVSDPQSRVRVVATLRADFYDRPLMYPGFGDLVKRRTFAVVPLSAEEMSSAIVSPAAAAGVEVDSDLVTEMVADVLEQPGALPLLQYAMTELFENRSANSITSSGYRGIGGVFGALGNRSEGIFTSLDAQGREFVQQMFLRLVTLGEGTEDTRRRVPRAELISLLNDRTLAEIAIEQFGTSRLLSFDHDPITRDPTVEIAHEALIREWPRLRGWLDEYRDDIRMQRLLGGSAKEWAESGSESSYLLRGARLDQFEAWTARADISLSAVERTYLDASLAARRARRVEEANRQAHEAKLERRSRNVMRALVGVMAVAAAIGLTLAGAARSAQHDAETEADLRATQQLLAEQARDLANEEVDARATQQSIAVAEGIRAEVEARRAFSRELAASSLNVIGLDPQLALLLALESAEQTYLKDRIILPEADGALHQAVQANADRLIHVTEGLDPRIWRVFFNPDSSRAVTYGTSSLTPIWQPTGHTRVWDAESWELLTSLPGFLVSEGWLENGQLATVPKINGDGISVVFWNSTDGQAVRAFEFEILQSSNSAAGAVLTPEDVSSALVSPDGRWFSLSWSQGERIHHEVWDLTTSDRVYASETAGGGLTFTSEISSMAFSPDGMRLLLGEDSGGELKLLDLSDLTLGPSGIAGRGSFRDLEYSPDGLLVATASTCQVYDDTSRVSGDICARAITQDLRETRLLHAESLQESVALFSRSGETWGVSFSPDGEMLAIAERSGVIRIVETRSGVDRYILPGHTSDATAADFNSDGTRLVTVGWDGMIHLWDVQPDFGFELLRLEFETPELAPASRHFTLSPDGETFALVSADALLQTFDATSGEPAAQALTLPNPPLQFQYGFGGGQIATLNGPGELELWDLATREHAVLVEGAGGCCFSFDGDGDLLAIATNPTLVKVFEVQGSSEGEVERLQELYEHRLNEVITEVAIGEDGVLLAVLGKNGLSRVFAAESGDRLRTLDYVAADSLSVAFDPRGGRLAIGYSDGVVRVRELADRESMLELRGHLAPVLAIDYSSDGSLLASASEDGTVRIWQSDTGQEKLVLSISGSGTTDVAFSPDSSRLYAIGADGVIKAYLLDIDELIELARSRLARDLTEPECVKYLHIPACPSPPGE